MTFRIDNSFASLRTLFLSRNFQKSLACVAGRIRGRGQIGHSRKTRTASPFLLRDGSVVSKVPKGKVPYNLASIFNIFVACIARTALGGSAEQLR